ncbi:DinB family protein [Bremerella cremea]|uniref:DinB family protein n=1 Tax=Bremerella cremea TaxID=1031537 RepID=UPI0031EABD04
MTDLPPFQRYLDLAPEADCVETLARQFEEEFPRLKLVSEEEASIVHPPYAWTIKEVIGHMSDTERVFSYRALRFARGDTTELPGFDQDLFMANSNFNDRPYHQLLQELYLIRQSTMELFRTLPEGALDLEGTAAGYQWTVRNLGRCSVGHVRHHAEIIQQRLAGGS